MKANQISMKHLLTPENKVFFAFLAERRDSKSLSVDRFITGTRRKLDRLEIVSLLKQMDNFNLGNFVAGRREFPSRFRFYFTPASIGTVVLNQGGKLEPITFHFSEEVRKESVNRIAVIPPKSAATHRTRLLQKAS